MEEVVRQRAQVRPKEKVSIEGGWPQVTSVPEQRMERQVQDIPDWLAGLNEVEELDKEDCDEESVRYDVEGMRDSSWQP